MKAYSNINPNDFEIVEENEIIKAILSRNVIEETSESGDKYYSCEQTKINVDSKDNLEEFLKVNFNELFELGLQKEYELKIDKENINE